MKYKKVLLVGLVIVAAAAVYQYKDQLFVDREASLLSPEAQFRQGEMSENGWGRPKNTNEAIDWYELAAANDYAEAQYRLGELYHSGQRVQQDFKKAMKYYMQAANNGNVDAEYQLGVMYQRGEGVEVDRVEAEKWFSMAREQGHQKVPPKTG